MSALIRVAQLSDASGIVAVYGPYCDSTIVSFEVVAPSIEQMQDRIRQISDGFPWLVAEIDGRIAGYVYANRHRERAAYQWAVDVAVYIAAAYHRRGIGRALYTSLFEILRELGYYKAIAGVSLPNPGSVGLHERMGFRQAAVFHGVGFKCGQWVDVGWWELELQPQRPDPPEPRRFSAVRESSAVRSSLATGQRLLARVSEKS
jgi:phosphinothricin acetyltransferase